MNELFKEYNGKMIPKDWTGYKISEIVQFEGGAQPPKSEFIYEEKDGYIRLIQIRDYRNNDYLTFIPKELARKFCDETDIMIGRYGPPIFQILRGLKGAYNVALMKAIPNETIIDKDYLYYYLQLESLFKLIDKLSRRSSGQTGIDLDALNNFDIPLPKMNEQIEIVNLIKISEEVVKKQEQLIEKKKEFKKGLMQRLLSGEVRFKEFNDEWEEKEIGNYIEEYKEKSIVNNQYPVLTSSRNGLVLQTEYFKDNQVTTNENVGYNVIPYKYITFRTRSDDGTFVFNQNNIIEKGIVSYFYPVFKFKKEMNTYFAITWLNNCIDREIRREIVGTSQLVLSLNKLKKFKIMLPKIEEQNKIAETLMFADKEIELLQKELEVLKLQKKGLMQRLLTGEVRVKV